MLLAMKDEAGSNLSNEENDFMLDTSYGEDSKELTAAVMLMDRLQPAYENAEIVPSCDAKAVSQVHALSKINEKVSHGKHKTIQTTDDDQIDSNIIFDDPFVENNGGTSEHDSTDHDESREIQMLAYNVQPGLGYTNPVRLKKAIAAQPKMYDGDLIHNNKLVIHTTDSEETLEDADESRNKMRHKMVQIDYEKLNALYETFVPQQELSAEQTYFSIPSTSDNGSTSKDVPSESPGPKMPTESRLLTMIDTLGDTIIGFQTRINKTFLQDTERRWLSDSQNELREFYKTDVIPMSRSLYKTLREIKEELIEEVQEMLNIFVSMEQKVNDKSPTENILENEIDRLLEASLTSEIRNCVLLLTYAYADISAQNQDLLMTIYELKSKLKTIDKGKHVNMKFDKSETLRQLPCVTPFNNNLEIKAKNVSNTKIKQEDTKTPDSKANTNVSNSTGVSSSNSVRRPKSKDNKSKNNVLKNTKSSSTFVLKTMNSVFLDSNKCETKPLNVCQTNACITNAKTVNAVNDGLNILCISCGLDVFLYSHEKCVARNALTRKSSVQRALFTSPVAAKSKGLEATSVVAKSRFSVAKTPTATNKVSSVSPLSQKSSQSRILSSYMKNKIATSRKWQKWFEYQQGFNWTPKSKTAKSQSNVHTCRTSVKSKTNTPVTTNKWVAKPSTLPSAFVSCNAGDPACAVDC
ncbi:hypothetical protein Tco_1456802 [Tanacetum coccineum]